MFAMVSYMLYSTISLVRSNTNTFRDIGVSSSLYENIEHICFHTCQQKEKKNNHRMELK